jgi:hypothetical protein
MSPRDVTGKYAVKNCGAACKEWDYNFFCTSIVFQKELFNFKSLYKFIQATCAVF